MTTEIWKPVVGFVVGLEASSRGRIRLNGKIKPASLTGKYYKIGRGYLAVKIGKRLVKVHTLVATAFHGPCPPDHECDHGGDGTTDNRPEKLEWVTPRVNQLRSIERGHRIPLAGEFVGTSKLTVKKVLNIRNSPLSQRAAAHRFGISKTQVGRIRRKESWNSQYTSAKR